MANDPEIGESFGSRLSWVYMYKANAQFAWKERVTVLAGTIINVELIGVVVTILIVATIILTAAALYSSVGAWIMPRLKRVSLGLTARKKQLLCCPPGLGCNDPIPRMNACRREAALRGAEPEELQLLDGAWAKLNLTPRRKKAEFQKAYVEYNSIRDRIMANIIRKATDGADLNSANLIGAGVETTDVHAGKGRNRGHQEVI